MIYFLGIFSGFVNGFLTSGAGQILIFYLVFIKKYDTHMSRNLSIILLSISSIVSLIGMLIFNKISIIKSIIVFIISLILGILGTKFMNKIDSKLLNLISGILLLVLSVYKLFF